MTRFVAVAALIAAIAGVGLAAAADKPDRTGPDERMAADAGQKFDGTGHADAASAVSAPATDGKNNAAAQLKAAANGAKPASTAWAYAGFPRRPGESDGDYAERRMKYNIGQDPENPHNPSNFYKFLGRLGLAMAAMVVVGVTLGAGPALGLLAGVAVYFAANLIPFLHGPLSGGAGPLR